jgi:hypothetical protein
MHSNQLFIIRGIAFLFALSLVACGDSNSIKKVKPRNRVTNNNIVKNSNSEYGLGQAPWTKQLGEAGIYTYENSVATDVSGDVYIAGTANRGLDGNTLTGTKDFFLTKYDSSGAKLYTKQMGASGTSTWGVAVATDVSNNVYIVGTTFGGLNGNTLIGTSDCFLTKYDSSGTKIYTKQIGVSGVNTWGFAVTTDSSGNVYVVGTTFGGLDGNTLTGTRDFFLAKYNSSGTKMYTKQLGVTGAATYANAVETDVNGDIIVSGVTSGGLDGNACVGSWNSFVTKYSHTGTKLSTKLSSVLVH